MHRNKSKITTYDTMMRGKTQRSLRKYNRKDGTIYIGDSKQVLSEEVTLCCEPGKEQRGKQAAGTACAKTLRLESEWPMQQGEQVEEKIRGQGQGHIVQDLLNHGKNFELYSKH